MTIIFGYSLRGRRSYFRFDNLNSPSVACDAPDGPWVDLGYFATSSNLRAAGVNTLRGEYVSFDAHSWLYPHFGVEIYRPASIVISHGDGYIPAWEVTGRLTNRAEGERYILTDVYTCSHIHADNNYTAARPVTPCDIFRLSELQRVEFDPTLFYLNPQSGRVSYRPAGSSGHSCTPYFSVRLDECRFTLPDGRGPVQLNFVRRYSASRNPHYVLAIGEEPVVFSSRSNEVRCYINPPETIGDLISFVGRYHPANYLSVTRPRLRPIDLYTGSPIDKDQASKVRNHAGDVMGYTAVQYRNAGNYGRLRGSIVETDDGWSFVPPSTFPRYADPAHTGRPHEDGDEEDLVQQYHCHHDYPLLTSPVPSASALHYGRKLSDGAKVPLYFGVELECDAVEPRDFNDIYNDGVRGKNMVFQTDGSLRSYGFEAITRPLGYDEQVALWSRTPAEWPTGRDSSADCGMHVHVTRAAIAPAALIRLYRLMTVLPHDLIHAIAGRSSSSFASLEGMKRVNRRLLALGYNQPNDRYLALNATTNTIEYRLFAGSISRHNILVRLQFVLATILYTRTCTLAQSGAPEAFTAWVGEYGLFPDLSGVIAGHTARNRRAA